jgi:1,4-dihydroxy-2-naphthoate octaprenyltransferase
MRNFWKGFWLLVYPKIWITSTLPFLVGTALAYGMTKQFNLYWFLVSLAGLYFIEIGKNAANDLVDYLSGADLAVAEENITPFSGGRNRVLVNGYLNLQDAAAITVVMLIIGSLFGLYITFCREAQIFWIGSAGLFLAYAYSLPPFKLAYRGLGELAVGIAFGPLIVSGAFVIQAHFLTWEVFWVSLPIGFLVVNILLINQYPDYEADKSCNKRNWVVRLGKARGLRVYSLLFALAYLSLALLFLLTKNPLWLLTFVSLPLAVRAVRTAASALNNISEFIGANVNTFYIYQLTGLFMLVSALLCSRF